MLAARSSEALVVDELIQLGGLGSRGSMQDLSSKLGSTSKYRYPKTTQHNGLLSSFCASGSSLYIFEVRVR